MSGIIPSATKPLSKMNYRRATIRACSDAFHSRQCVSAKYIGIMEFTLSQPHLSLLAA